MTDSERNALITAVQTRYDHLRYNVLDPILFDNLESGLSRINNQDARENFVYHLREEMGDRISELLDLTRMLERLNNGAEL